MHIERPAPHAVVIVPHALEEVLRAHHASLVLGEGGEQLELFPGEVPGLAAHDDLVAVLVDADLAEVQHIGRPGRLRVFLGPAESRVDPGDELIGPEGLDEVVVGADLEADDPLHQLVATGDHDDRDRAVLADLAADVEAVTVG